MALRYRVTVERDLSALVMDPRYSAYRESLLSRLFVADLITAAWRAGYPPLEIARPDIDFQGYDLVATCGPITRHLQIKAIAGKSGEVFTDSWSVAACHCRPPKRS